MKIETNQLNKKNKNNKSFFTTILLAILLSTLIKVFVFEFMLVSGESMMDTIESGEKIAALKITKPENGDIILIRHEGTLMIKRLIAKEGDTIEIKDNELYLNGELIEEDYIREKMITNDTGEIQLAKGQMYVMGDNRNNSHDSKMFGVLEKENYVGKAMFKIKGFKISKIEKEEK